MSRTDVFITDYALSCATGLDTETALSEVFSGQSGLTEENGKMVGRVPGVLADLPGHLAQYDSRQARLGHTTVLQISNSIRNAREKWGPERVAIILGTSTGGIESTERAYLKDKGSFNVDASTQQSFGALPQMLQKNYGLSGPAYAISTACSSSAMAFGSAQRLIQNDIVDVVLVLGVDTLCQLTLRGFDGLGLLSKGRCRPFDKDRDGINIGEAGAAVLLQREAQNARFQLKGFGASSDGYHMTRPSPDGIGAIRSMTTALKDSGLSPELIVAVNAHGTGTIENDKAEAKAIHAVFGNKTPVVSTKGFVGHTLGACGALDAVICIESLKRQMIPATTGYNKSPDGMNILVQNSSFPIEGRFIASNSFAFGGNNATIVIGEV